MLFYPDNSNKAVFWIIMKFFALTYKFFRSHGGQKSLLSKAWDDIRATNNFTTIDLDISDYVLSNTALWAYYEKVKSLETDIDFIKFKKFWDDRCKNYLNRHRRSDKKDESWWKFTAKYPDLHEKLNADTKQHYERVFKYESRKERITTILTTIFYLIRDLVGSIILDAIDACIIITEDIANIIVAKSLQFMSFCDRCKSSISRCFYGKASDTSESVNEPSPPTNNEDDNDAGINTNIDKNTTLTFSSSPKSVKRKLDFGDQKEAGQETANVSYASLHDDPVVASNFKSTPQSIISTLLSPFSQTPSTAQRIRSRTLSQ